MYSPCLKLLVGLSVLLSPWERVPRPVICAYVPTPTTCHSPVATRLASRTASQHLWRRI